MPDRIKLGTGATASLAARPSPLAHAIDRRALWARLDELVDAHRVVVVIAPAGFGKTSFLSAWAGSGARRVAWLSLTTADRHVERFSRSLDAMLDDLDIDPEPSGADAVESADDHRVLVIDDADLANTPEARELLGGLLAQPPAGLRIVIAGRSEPKVGLTKLLVAGDLGRLAAEDLVFSAEEVGLAATMMGLPVADARAEELHALTGGWPVAVRLAVMSLPSSESRLSAAVRISADADIPQLVDYLVENVISQLPAGLRAFVPRACVCDWVTGRLANELAGNDRGAEMLERALALGLPLERRGMFRGEPVYRWHPVMAQAGRAILLRQDSAAAFELDRKAARFLASIDPYEAASLALRGHDPELAAQLIRTQWLGAVLRGDSELIEDLCARLSSPWTEDPQILSVRATCRRNAGDALGAVELRGRAEHAARALDADERQGFDLTNQLAVLFLADEGVDLAEASASAQRALASHPRLDGALRACATLLIGLVELRLRRGPVAVRLLREATLLCQAEGLDDLAERARANQTFALAFAGDFVSARAALTEAIPGAERARWRRTDGGLEEYARGWIQFWSGEQAKAVETLRQALGYVASITSYTQLARVQLPHAMLACGESPASVQAVVDALPSDTIQGLPWPFYKATAQAGILLAQGEPQAAADLLDSLMRDAPYAPAMAVFTAELYWRCGRPAQARERAAFLSKLPAYLGASGLVVTALCDRHDGDTQAAHAALEEALELGSTLGLSRPFQFADPALEAMLAEHAARGTRYAAFLAAQLAFQRARTPDQGVAALSAREKEILGYLATTMTASEICGTLFISANTLKTHLRSIYRKLGVENRRDAVRLA